MKQYLIKIFVFFAIIALLDVIFGFGCCFLADHARSGETARTKGVLQKDHYNIMTMGSSRCVCHYDDQMMSDSLGLSVINAGVKGNGIVMMYGQYHVIPRSLKPQILIYDVEPAFDAVAYEGDDHNHRYLDGLKLFYDEPGIKEIFTMVDPKEPLKMTSQLYRFNSKLFTLLKDYLTGSKAQRSSYLPADKEYSSPEKRKPEQARDYDSIKLHYFKQLILDTKADGVQLIVVASPKYGADSTRDLLPIIQMCTEYEIPFWDYYYDMHDTHWFCDNMHLNLAGSKEFTKIIIKRLQSDIL